MKKAFHLEGILPDGVNLVDDLHVARKQLAHDLDRPLFQGLWHDCVICESQCLHHKRRFDISLSESCGVKALFPKDQARHASFFTTCTDLHVTAFSKYLFKAENGREDSSHCT